eukprot:TRINITY_DN3717_c8_g1_i1.p1 TRINITY_DN3717_c8_g1~~TRINITY_DN3717_c8_g1_i1.p1  ORF type:complete len:461 (+),score=86.18 TRINITY_DN3717_c8_g1_i1:88-1383(+)
MPVPAYRPVSQRPPRPGRARLAAPVADAAERDAGSTCSVASGPCPVALPPAAAPLTAAPAGVRTGRSAGRPTVKRARSAGATPRCHASPPPFHVTEGSEAVTPRGGARNPNWTLDASERLVRRPTPRRQPERGSPPPGEDRRQLFAAEARVPSTLSAEVVPNSSRPQRSESSGRPRIPESTQGCDARMWKCDVRSYPNWTIPSNASDAGSARASTPSGSRRHWNSNGDIEGSRPAITKFSRAVRRIVADPWPGSPRAPARPRREALDTAPWGALPEPASAARSRRSGGRPVCCKEIERFQDGQYVVTEVITGAGAGHSGAAGGMLQQSRGLCTADIAGAQSCTARDAALQLGRARSPRAMRSLCTADIPGARPCSVGRSRPAGPAPERPAAATGASSQPPAGVPPPRPASPAASGRRLSHRSFMPSQISLV